MRSLGPHAATQSGRKVIKKDPHLKKKGAGTQGAARKNPRDTGLAESWTMPGTLWSKRQPLELSVLCQVKKLGFLPTFEGGLLGEGCDLG